MTVEDFLNKYKDADILILFFLSAHYAHPIDYNDEKIEEVLNKLKIEEIKHYAFVGHEELMHSRRLI